VAAILLYQQAGSPDRISVRLLAVNKNLLMNLFMRKIVPAEYMGRRLDRIHINSYWDNFPNGETDIVLSFTIPEGMLVPAKREEIILQFN
jgi:hypothetical protein